MAHMRDVREGMVVYSADGHRVGKVLAVGSSQFQVEKGLLFHHDFLVSISDVVEVKGHALHLRRAKANIPGVYGGYHDRGYADRGFAGEREPEPVSGVGAGLPPPAETAAPRTAQASGPRTDPHLHAPVGTGAQVGMTGDVAHPELGPPLAPALGPTRGAPAHAQGPGISEAAPPRKEWPVAPAVGPVTTRPGELGPVPEEGAAEVAHPERGTPPERPREPPRLAHEDLSQRAAHREVHAYEPRPAAPREPEGARPAVPPPERKK